MKDFLQQNGLFRIVYPENMNSCYLIAKLKEDSRFFLTEVEDERSSMYVACGIALEKNEKVCLLMKNNQSGLNIASGLTESFYNHIPIIILTDDMDFLKGIKDLFRMSLYSDEINNDHIINYNFPMKIVFEKKWFENDKNIINYKLKSENIHEKYDYIFKVPGINSDLKNVIEIENGIISYSLGFSLGKKCKILVVLKYIDFIKELNVLGNKHFNSMIDFVIIGKDTISFLDNNMFSIDKIDDNITYLTRK